jgi:hypothetical protein
MHSKLIRALTVGVFTIGTAAMAHAQQSGPIGRSVDVGKYEYDRQGQRCLRGAPREKHDGAPT